MKTLGFTRDAEVHEGKRVRRSQFESRSSLPVSAACVVANGVRETLGALLGVPVSLRLLEPVLPDATAWTVICQDAQLHRVRGPLADAAFVLRANDALALAAAAFGESAENARELSPLENQVVCRALSALSGCLSAICGRDLSPVERVVDIRGYVTYFELLVERPVTLRLGVALSREPLSGTGPLLRVQDLLDVQIELAVEFARGSLGAAAVLDLRAGSNVPMSTRLGEPALLTAAGTVLARGECGALSERNAFIVRGT